MDREHQIRLNYLDEAEECLEGLEASLLELASSEAPNELLDQALRAAHSIKGGAAMMGYVPLSQVAHRLEDFLKILRVRYGGSSVGADIEMLLLKGVDYLCKLIELHRQGLESEALEQLAASDTIFEPLRQRLGELQAEDEDALLAQNEDIDPALFIFENGVEAVLDRLEGQLQQFSPSQISQELALTAEELLAFGHMTNLKPFIQLCYSIQQQNQQQPLPQIEEFARRALMIWRRSHALVMRGSLDKLPSALDPEEILLDVHDAIATIPELDQTIDEQSLVNALAELDLTELKYEFDNFDLSSSENQLPSSLLEVEMVQEPDLDTRHEILLNDSDLADLRAAFEINLLELDTVIQPNLVEAKGNEKISPTVELVTDLPPIPTQLMPAASQTVRVPVDQLQQFNMLFGKLVLERNTVNFRLEQLKNVATLMRQRMQQLEQSNNQLRKWYDRASLENGLLNQVNLLPTEINEIKNASTQWQLSVTKSQFDTLEMDQYTDLHLISQDQIETIVQLQEVTTDIELGVQEIQQVVRELTQTTKMLQSKATRIQMVPFGELVKRFPRAIRDLSLQLGKQVKFSIQGEATLIDRSTLESLSSPLMHLLRNAVDHGIEDPKTRVAAGKPQEGSITLEAVNLGTQTFITLRDDGNGIRLDKIRDRLYKMGLSATHVDQMSQSEILDFIFEPGFSTTDMVTEVSGRGVGMDVVRSNLREIRGEIQVKTHPGSGTTFTLCLPFTLSILRVMLLESAGITFAVPVSSVRELVRFQPEKIQTDAEFLQMDWNGQTIPIVKINDSLAFRHPCKSLAMSGNPVINRNTVLVIGEGKMAGGIQIDRFWGEQEVTLRPISSPLPLPFGFISSTVLGDGRVIPLVDPLKLLSGCLENETIKKKTNRGSLYSSNDTLTFQPESRKILVVDDSINVRRYLALTLEKVGYQVEQAKDGQEAVEKLLSGLSVQGIICDIEMPRLDGYGVLEEVKSRPEFQKLPIVMLTSRSNEKHRKLAMRLGASAYLSKPFNEHHLLQTLAEFGCLCR
jgi:chemosensory pili system protein ChpA (sensor histidine kinase/response regulator)